MEVASKAVENNLFTIICYRITIYELNMIPSSHQKGNYP